MEGKKSNKIREIVRLQQILKKWKKLALSNSSNNNGGSNKGIKFLKKTLSFSETTHTNSHSPSRASADHVPKGYLAVCVGKEFKRYVIPTHYLGHRAFNVLLREAEEEFGFHQEGVLKIPSDVSVFERVLRMVEVSAARGSRRERNYEDGNAVNMDGQENYLLGVDFSYQQEQLDVMSGCCSPDSSDHLIQCSHPQLCR